MKIVLLGYMGSGKSSVANSLSKQLNFVSKDLDRKIERIKNKSITELFSDRGEIYFRKKEAELLQTLLVEPSSMVLALGGGTPCYGTIMQDLNANDEVITVYLKLSLDALTERLFQEKEKRPLIAHLQTKELLNDFIRKHLFERSYYYDQASIIIDTDGKQIDEISRAILAQLF